MSRLPVRFAHLAADPNIELDMPERGLAIGREGRFFVDGVPYQTSFS